LFLLVNLRPRHGPSAGNRPENTLPSRPDNAGVVTVARPFSVLDGVYAFTDDTKEPFFIETPPPADEDVKQVAETVAVRAIRLLERRGVIGEQDAYDPFSEESPVLAGMTAASVRNMIATGDRAGLPVRRVLSDPARGVRTSHLCYVSRGFSLHAARRVEANDRAGLEQLCSYVTRPPLASGSLEKVGDDKYLFKMKSSWSDGTSHIILSGHELLEKLASIVPPPRSNTTRYHGILAPAAKQRAKVVPAETNGNEPSEERKKSGSTKYRLAWAALLSRVFQIDVSVCPACGQKMKIIAFITDPASIHRYLKGENLPTEPPPIAPARSPPQLDSSTDQNPPSKKRPLGQWTRASWWPKSSLSENLCSARGRSPYARTTALAPKHNTKTTRIRFTV
jgi:hypothetical protein